MANQFQIITFIRSFQEEISKINYNVGKYQMEFAAKMCINQIIELKSIILHSRFKSSEIVLIK
jgi:hypothetical protein